MESKLQYVRVYIANGKLDAEMVKAFLEASGIHALAAQESAGITYGLTIGPLGEVDIFVPIEQEANARELLADMEKGKFENDASDEDLPKEEE